MGRLWGALLAGAVLLGLLVPGASAHEVKAGTSIRVIRVPAGVIPRGDPMVIFGKLRSSERLCKAGRTVHLMRVRPGKDRALGKDVTDREGEYLFYRRARKNQTVYVKFDRFTRVGGGHDHVCAGSKSKRVRVKVT